LLARACSAGSNVGESAGHGAAQKKNYLARKKKTVKAKAMATAQEELDKRLNVAAALAGSAAQEVLSDDAAEEPPAQQHAAASSSGPAAEAPAAAMGSGVAEGAAEKGGVSAAMRARFNRSIMQAAAGDDEDLVAVKAFALQIKKMPTGSGKNKQLQELVRTFAAGGTVAVVSKFKLRETMEKEKEASTRKKAVPWALFVGQCGGLVELAKARR
jgi:hypothetical protein